MRQRLPIVEGEFGTSQSCWQPQGQSSRPSILDNISDALCGQIAIANPHTCSRAQCHNRALERRSRYQPRGLLNVTGGFVQVRTGQTRIAPRSPKKLNVSTAAMHPSLPKRVNLDQVTRFCLPFNFRFAPKATVSDRSAACRDRPKATIVHFEIRLRYC